MEKHMNVGSFMLVSAFIWIVIFIAGTLFINCMKDRTEEEPETQIEEAFLASPDGCVLSCPGTVVRRVAPIGGATLEYCINFNPAGTNLIDIPMCLDWRERCRELNIPPPPSEEESRYELP